MNTQEPEHNVVETTRLKIHSWQTVVDGGFSLQVVKDDIIVSVSLDALLDKTEKKNEH